MAPPALFVLLLLLAVVFPLHACRNRDRCLLMRFDAVDVDDEAEADAEDAEEPNADDEEVDAESLADWMRFSIARISPSTSNTYRINIGCNRSNKPAAIISSRSTSMLRSWNGRRRNSSCFEGEIGGRVTVKGREESTIVFTLILNPCTTRWHIRSKIVIKRSSECEDKTLAVEEDDEVATGTEDAAGPLEEVLELDEFVDAVDVLAAPPVTDAPNIQVNNRRFNETSCKNKMSMAPSSRYNCSSRVSTLPTHVADITIDVDGCANNSSCPSFNGKCDKISSNTFR